MSLVKAFPKLVSLEIEYIDSQYLNNLTASEVSQAFLRISRTLETLSLTTVGKKLPVEYAPFISNLNQIAVLKNLTI
jgi:hypothetical protein